MNILMPVAMHGHEASTAKKVEHYNRSLVLDKYKNMIITNRIDDYKDRINYLI